MELTFDKATGICEFEVTGDFNLHIERDTPGSLAVYQRTAGGEYKYVEEQGYLSNDKVIDLDFTALVYPKWIKIKSSVLPSVAVVTSLGDVTELKYQSKSVKIESNGTTSVTPDAGYNGLSEVSVEVDVPTEGGTSEEWIYLDLSNATTDEKSALAGGGLPVIGRFVDLTNNIIKFVAPLGYAGSDFGTWHGIDYFAVAGWIYVKYNFQDVMIKDMVDTLPFPRITKEQFYSIPKPITIAYNDENTIKEVFEKIYPTITSYEQDEYNIDLPLTTFGYTTITLDWISMGILKITSKAGGYRLNRTFYSSHTFSYIEGEGTCDMIFLEADGDTRSHIGIGKIYLNDGSIRYSIFSIPA